MGKLSFSFALLLILQALTAAQNIPVSEINALIQFGQQMRSPIVVWNTNQNFCSQQGIVCSAQNDAFTVSGIVLANAQLSGVLSSSLSDLPNLRLIDLSNNSITGTIPAAYSQLQNLTTLNLSKNLLFGTIPYTFSQFTNLRNLNLANNYLAGGLPPNFNYGQLNTLLLAGNQFCPIPDFSQVTNNDYASSSTNSAGCQICNSYSCLNGGQCFVNSDQTFRCNCGANFVGQFCELSLSSYGPQPQTNPPNNQTGNNNQTGQGPIWSQGNPGVQPGDTSAAASLSSALFPLFLATLASFFFLQS